MSTGSIALTPTQTGPATNAAKATTFGAREAGGATGAVDAGGTMDSSTTSGPAQMLNNLKRLEESDPSKFKKVMSEISDKLSTAAKSATDPQQARMLTDLSAKFQAAGQSGDLSALQPAGRGAGPNGPPPSGGAPPAGGTPPAGASPGNASGSASSTKVHDPADTNYDGKVSAQERAAYAAKESAQKAAHAAGQRAYADQLAGPHDIESVTSSLAAIVGQALGADGSATT